MSLSSSLPRTIFVVYAIGIGGASIAEPVRSVCAASPGSTDRSEALQACFDRAEDGDTVRLRPGRYTIDAPLTIRRSITLTTGDPRGDGCLKGLEHHCATLAVGRVAGRTGAMRMPIEVTAVDVTMVNVRILGMRGIDAAYDRRVCLDDSTRPAGGGIRVVAGSFTLKRSVIMDIPCYTAMEVVKGADGLVVEQNRFSGNGDHRPGKLWSDGLTVHDLADAQIVDNVFVDNTDVQLILGGCRDCLVARNRFRHGGSFAGSSFAELMLQSWPTTSGAFDRSKFRDNHIDCGARRRCGYGIMVGSNPWYPGRASGGELTGNHVRSAMIGINVDTLTGPMIFRGNNVTASGGRFASACGTRTWPAVNVAASSLPFVRGDLLMRNTGRIPTTGCLVNQMPEATEATGPNGFP